MIDLRFYKSDNDITKTISEFYERMELSSSSEPVASSIEILAGKVVKYLLTARGSDAFDPDYGGTAFHYTQLSEAYIPKFRLEVLDDLSRCADYIRTKSEAQLSDYDTETDRLYTINLIDIKYTILTRIDVYIEIISTKGKHHVVTITKNTES